MKKINQIWKSECKEIYEKKGQNYIFPWWQHMSKFEDGDNIERKELSNTCWGTVGPTGC